MGKSQRRRRKFAPIVRKVGSCAFCDNGAMIELDDIAAALDADRGAGFADPTPDEVILMIQGDDANGVPPAELCAAHPALEALLVREMS